jgi:dTMP kinase
MSERGKYIVVEGGEFAGKTTQLDKLKDYIAQSGLEDSFLYTREPGGTPAGEDLRKVLFFPNEKYFPEGELPDRVALQIFTANRVFNWRTQIEPALMSGINVLSDRNWFSTLSYQGARGEVTEEEIIETTTYSLPEGYMHPDLAYILTVPTAERVARQARTALQDGTEMDAFEQRDTAFHDSATEIYRRTVTKMGAVGIDGARSIDNIHAEMVMHLNETLGR